VVVSFQFLLFLGRPGEGSFEHSCRTDEAIVTPALAQIVRSVYDRVVAIRCVAYHQEVRLGIGLVALEREDARVAQVLGQGHPQMGVVELAQVLGPRRVRDTRLTVANREVRLSQTPAFDQDVDCIPNGPSA
jgi:hypothetical protein